MAAISDNYTSVIAEVFNDEPAYRLAQLEEGIYRQFKRPEEILTLPGALRNRIAAALPQTLHEAAVRVADDGQTTKWLFDLDGGAQVETVLMRYEDRVTVCVSSQAGCAMNCSFCATGQAGFSRHLSTSEIVEQVLRAAREAQPRRLSNVVFMGMGEPLANFDALWPAIEIIHGKIGLSARHLTVSTVGLLPGIRRLASADLPVNLAVSLHAARDELRSELVPINRRYPLDELAKTCADYLEATHRRITFEWALIDGVNDSARDASELAAYARPLGAHVNLIPLNPTPGYAVRGSSASTVAKFSDELASYGVNVTVRSTRGSEIDAACGQLAGQAVSIRRDR
ncbi:MAG: 23S rRNA (adenine(2503)-C(2))-methyltransferase RlmN [Actinomycetes bacterium]